MDLGGKRTYGLLSGTSTLEYSDLRFQANFTLVSQNVANNSSLVRVTYLLERVGADPFGGVKCKVNIGGTTKQKTLNVYEGYPTGTHNLGTHEWTIYHNSDGTKSFTANGTLEGYWWYEDYRSRGFSITITLPAIPRAPVYNSRSASNITKSSALLTATIDSKGLSITSGGWQTTPNADKSGITTRSGDWLSKTVTGLTPGTTYYYRGYCTTSGGTTYSSWSSFATTSIATITNASVNFNVGDGIELTFTNPTSEQVDLTLELPNGTSRITRTNITSPYNLTLSEPEKNIIYGLIPTNEPVAFRFKLTTAGTDSTYKSGYVSITNANPIFTNWTYKDINTTTTNLTGDNQKIIKGYSKLEGTVSVANKMVAIKGATADKYQLVIGGKQTTANYSADSPVVLEISEIDNNVFQMYAIDSRGNNTIKQISPSTYIEYTNITKGNAYDNYVERVNNISQTTRLVLKGNYYEVNFGNKNNSAKVQYSFKKTTDTTYGTWEDIILTNTSGEYTFDGNIKGDLGASGFSTNDSFDLKIRIYDELSEVYLNLTLESGKPNIAIHKDGVAFGALYDETLGGALQVNGQAYFNSKLLLDVFYPVGTIYETTSTALDTTTKMANYFGGTWEAYGAGRTSVGYNASETEFNEIGKTGGAKTHTLTVAQMPPHKHTMYNPNTLGAPLPSGVEHSVTINGGNAFARQLMLDAGGGGAHNNLQPYIVVYRYRRTA